MPTSVEKEILKTISYFNFFDYQPTFDEIHLFLIKKTPKKKLGQILNNLVKKNTLVEYGKKYEKDTQGRYGILISQKSKVKSQNWLLRQDESERKLKKIKLFISILSKFPQIKLIGLSGSMAMMNAGKKDDIDLFIISDRERMFTARFLALSLAQLFSLRRKRNDNDKTSGKNQDKVCLNLFFDEANLSVPKFKRSQYVAHEVLQMKPHINKNQICERFLEANKWVYGIFPNAKNNLKFKIKNLKLTPIKSGLNENSKFKIKNFLGDCFEKIVKLIQLWSINRHKTTEIITNTQLWFFPDDFEKKIIGVT